MKLGTVPNEARYGYKIGKFLFIMLHLSGFSIHSRYLQKCLISSLFQIKKKINFCSLILKLPTLYFHTISHLYCFNKYKNVGKEATKVLL